jgi:Lipase (class 3)
MDRSALLKPLFIIVKDRSRRALLLIIRGTTSLRDIFTSLSGTTKPHHVMGANGVVLGYSHFGMLAAARWIHRQAKPTLDRFLAQHPDWRLHLIGHSLGAGTAALLAMMCAPAAPTRSVMRLTVQARRLLSIMALCSISLRCALPTNPLICPSDHSVDDALLEVIRSFGVRCRLREEEGGTCARATATAFACPACATRDLAASCAGYVTTVLHAADLVPTFSEAALERLRQEARPVVFCFHVLSYATFAHLHAKQCCSLVRSLA